MRSNRAELLKKIQVNGELQTIHEDFCYAEEKNPQAFDAQFELAIVKAIVAVKDQKNFEKGTELLKALFDFLTEEILEHKPASHVKLIVVNTLQSLLEESELAWNYRLANILWDFNERTPGFFAKELVEQFIQKAIYQYEPELLQRIGFYFYNQGASQAAESKLVDETMSTQALLYFVLSGQKTLKVHCYENIINTPTDIRLSSLAELVNKLKQTNHIELYFKIFKSPVILMLEKYARINFNAANELSEIYYHAWLNSESQPEKTAYYLGRTIWYARQVIRSGDNNVAQLAADRIVKIYEQVHPEASVKSLENKLTEGIVKPSQAALDMLKNIMPAAKVLHHFYCGPNDSSEEDEIAHIKANDFNNKMTDSNNEKKLTGLEFKVFSPNLAYQISSDYLNKLEECRKVIRKSKTKELLFNILSEQKNPDQKEDVLWAIYNLWNKIDFEPYEVLIFSTLLHSRFDTEQKDIFPFTSTLAVLFADLPNIKRELPENIYNNIMDSGLKHFTELPYYLQNRVRKWNDVRLAAASIQAANTNAARNNRIKKYALVGLAIFANINALVRAVDFFCWDNLTQSTISSNLFCKIGNKITQPITQVFNEIYHREFYQHIKSCRNGNGDLEACVRAVNYGQTHDFQLIKELRQSLSHEALGERAALAVQSGNVDELKTMEQIDPESAILRQNKNLLLYAARNPNGAYVAEYLIRRHQYPVEFPSNPIARPRSLLTALTAPSRPDTPLMEALEMNNTEVAKVLVEHGASLEKKNRLGYYPLGIAISKNNLAAVKMIVNYHPILAKKIIDDNPALVSTAVEVNPEIFKTLYALGVLSLDTINRDEWRVIIAAVHHGNWDVVQIVFERLGNFNEFVNWLENYMNYFKDDGMVQLMHLLFKNGFEFNEKNDGSRFFQKACNMHYTKFATLLFGKGVRHPTLNNAVLWFSNRHGGPHANLDADILELLVKAAAERKDFEEIIKCAYLPPRENVLPRSFAILINAGHNFPYVKKGEFSQDLILKALDELKKLDELSVKHSKVEPRVKGLQTILTFAANNGYKTAVREILKTNLIDYETAKQTAIQIHKQHAGIYNLLRSHMRSLTKPLVSQHYAFYQPASTSPPLYAKESHRKRRVHR